MRTRFVSLVVLVVGGFLACGGEMPTQAPTSTAPSSTSSSQGAEAAPDASVWSPPGSDPTPTQVKRECGPLIDALKKATDGQERTSVVLRAKLDEIAKQPPMPQARFDWCRSLTERDLVLLAEEEKKPRDAGSKP